MSLHVKLVMPSDPHMLPVARAAVGEFTAVCGLPEETRQGVILAVDEALANVIRHAYKNRHTEEMQLDCQADEDCLVFTLLDQGEAPDPARICGQPLNEVSLSGRGTHLMRAIMDEMSYEQVAGGNQLRLVKRFHAGKANIAAEGIKPH